MTTKQDSIYRLEGVKESRKVGNNTFRIVYDNGDVAIRLHQTNVVTYHANGTTSISSGGWQTTTTKSRLNTYIPNNHYVYQRDFQWFVGKRNQDNEVVYEVDFYDGMFI
jgi:hypothetical protein